MRSIGVALRSLCATVVALATVPGSAAQPWSTHRVERTAGHKPHVLLLHDMEGLSGQDDPNSFLFGSSSYAHGRELLTADVNAVVEGLFAGGAGAVSIVDGHGSGNPLPDVIEEKLDPRARLLLRLEPFDPYVDLARPGAFDAVAVVGMHARSGSGGFAAHCLTIGVETRIGAHPLNETELVALLYGEAGIPVIFASGDDHLQRELRASAPWIEYVVTKMATSPSTASLLPVNQVHASLTQAANRAIDRLSSAQVMRAKAPVHLSVRAVPPANMKWLEHMPGVSYRNEMVSFDAKDFLAGYRGVEAVVRAASFSLEKALDSAFTKLPNASQLEAEGLRELVRQWLEAESGRVPARERAPAPGSARYNGFR